jgi:hypothetical protein
MNKFSEVIFTARQTVIVELPLNKCTRLIRPDQVILAIHNIYLDIGALCYALRSDKRKKRCQPQEVVISSILQKRPKQIQQLTKALSNLITVGGKSLRTTGGYALHIRKFVNFSDANGLHDCLAGGEATRNAFHAWATHINERYKRQQLGGSSHNALLNHVCELLEATTGLEKLMNGIRKIKTKTNHNGGTEPLALHDFAHAVAINQSLFNGLCRLVLEQQPFPHKLDLPDSLGWEENHLWLFPTTVWRCPPHMRNDTFRATWGSNASWPYDYDNGRIATVDEIEHRYKGRTHSERRKSAITAISRATERLNIANTDAHSNWRLALGMVAQRAFLFLFFCNTGGNQQVILDLETDGTINASVQNQKFRGYKWRARGKEVTLIAPATFTPLLRRFMELRQYLLQGKNTPYLFFSIWNLDNNAPKQIGDFELDLHYQRVLRAIDPQLPKMGARKLRASVDDYYLRYHDSAVAAVVMGHTPETEDKNYARGSANDHSEEMTLFMESVSKSAHHQRIIQHSEISRDTSPLEQGGHCDSFGHPEALAGNAPIQPDCRNSQGCLFCNHRVLTAGEEDARKIASAAYVMEQLIMGPKHEEALRPSIVKCEEDLEKIASFSNYRAMVEKVREDVYENENLTPFWADKYQLFLELGVVV